MDASRVLGRPRAIGRSRVSKPEQDKENRGRRPVRRKVRNNSCNERKLSTLRLRQSVEMCDGHVHVLRKDGPKIPTLKARTRGQRATATIKKSQTTSVTADQGLRNDLKVEVLNEAKNKVDVARRVTRRKKLVDIKPLPASQSEDKLPLKVPSNSPVDNTPEACKISEDVMVFLMQQVKVDDALDVSMESSSSPMSPEGYQSDILSYLKEREGFIAMRSVPTRPNIETLHREILVDWLIDVQVHLDLANETLHLAFAMLDAYLLNRSISLHYLQLLGLTCLYVASKYEEVYFPNLETLCKLCANGYKEGEFLIMERRILRTLDYDLFLPTAVDFVTRYLTLADIQDERLVLMCNYLVDLTLLCCHSKISCPSLWAATALFLALTVRKSETRHTLQDDLFIEYDMDETVWDGRWQAVTGYSESDLTELAQEMVEKVRVIKGSKYQASYRKYNTEIFQHISEELAKWCSTAEHLVSHNL